MRISENRAKSLHSELKELEIQIERDNEDVKIAVQKRDLSENTEYEAAMNSRRMHQRRKDEILEILNKAEIVPPGNTISIGSYLWVQETDEFGKPLAGKQERLFIMEEQGNTITDGILSMDSQLGRAIYNKMPGRFSYTRGDAKKFFTVRVDTSKDVERRFNEEHPISQKAFYQRIFGGVV